MHKPMPRKPGETKKVRNPHVSKDPITVESTIHAPAEAIWSAWNTPDDIKQWNAASEDWHTTASEVDLREGGRFSSRMESKDGVHGFDFGGTYTAVEPVKRLQYKLDDDRQVHIDFIDNGNGSVTVRETFDAEGTHTREMQQQGWQAILDNFKRHVEAKA